MTSTENIKFKNKAINNASTMVRILHAKGGVTISALINKNTIPVILDTGSDLSCVNLSLVKNLQIKLDSSRI
jgi:hypothetical protein